MRPKLTYANVVSTLALFLACAGGSAVAQQLLTGDDIQDGTITARDLAEGTATAPVLRPGEQIVGGFSVDAHAGAAGEDFAQFIPLGARTSQRIDDDVVMVDRVGDERCRGSVTRPTAPRGRLCLYVHLSRGVRRSQIEVAQLTGLGAVEDRGFSLGFTATGAGDAYIQGVWAYRAP
jgi:hypothetical protein